MFNLRVIFSEILKGYSLLNAPQFSGVFLKHLNSCDVANYDIKYDFYYKKAINQGLSTEKEKLEYLERESLWTKEDDKKIEELQSIITSLEKSKTKCIVRAELKEYNNKIEESRVESKSLQNKKIILLETTAESYATRRANDYYIYISLYKEDIITPYFLPEEFEDLGDNFNLIINAYNEKMEELSTLNLKKIALTGVFLNSFSLSDNDAFKFYGKPIIQLTLQQIELFNQGKIFHRILSECHDKIPETLLIDPEKLMEWYHTSNNAKQLLEKNSQTPGGSAIVGATKEELEMMGVDTSNSISYSDEVTRKGGSLSFQDILALHGS